MQFVGISATPKAILGMLNAPTAKSVDDARNNALKVAKAMPLPGFNSETMKVVRPGVPSKFGEDIGLHVTFQLEHGGVFDEETLAKASALNDEVANTICKFDDKDVQFLVGGAEYISEVGGFLYVSAKLSPDTKKTILDWIQRIFGKVPKDFEPHVSLAVIAAKDENHTSLMQALNIPSLAPGERHAPLKAIDELCCTA